MGTEDFPLKGRVRITIYESGSPFRYGDRVKIHRVRLHRPKGYGNPGAFDIESYMWTRGIVALGGVGRWDRVEHLGSGRLIFPLGQLYQLRDRLLQAIDEGLPSPYAPLKNGLLFGERRAIPREVQDAFYRSGTGHLMAISGLHVGFVAFFFFSLLKRLTRRLPRRLWARAPDLLTPDALTASLTIPLVLAYMVIARYPVSAIRATVMITVYLVARLLQRDRDLFGALGTAALLILLWQPLYLFDVGFQLSFLCVLCIVTVSQYLKPLRHVWGFVRITVLISLAVVPLIALYFHRVTVYGVLANLVMVPLASLLIPTGLVAATLSTVAGWASPFFFALTQGLSWLLLTVGQWVSSLPYAAPSIPPPSPLSVLAIYGVALSLMFFKKKGGSSRESSSSSAWPSWRVLFSSPGRSGQKGSFVSSSWTWETQTPFSSASRMARPCWWMRGDCRVGSLMSGTQWSRPSSEVKVSGGWTILSSLIPTTTTRGAWLPSFGNSRSGSSGTSGFPRIREPTWKPWLRCEGRGFATGQWGREIP